MSRASELIERAERETGQRVDADGSAALTMLFGALARELGTSSHREEDDFAAGVVVQHQVGPAGKMEKARDDMLANMLVAGVSPDDAKKIFG